MDNDVKYLVDRLSDLQEELFNARVKIAKLETVMSVLAYYFSKFTGVGLDKVEVKNV